MERLAYNQKDAAALLGISVNHFKEHVRPHLRASYIGNKIVYSREELQRFLSQ